MVGCGGCSGRFFGRFDDGRMRSLRRTCCGRGGCRYQNRARKGPADGGDGGAFSLGK